MPITRQDVNEDITAKITGKTIAKSITPTEDGANRVLMMDYVDQNIATKVLKTTITTTQVLDLFTTPITVLDSSNPLTIKLPLNIWIQRQPGTAYSLGASSFSLINDSGSAVSGNLNPNPLGSSAIGFFTSAFTIQQNYSGVDRNNLYKLKAQGSNPTGGTGDLDVYVTYIEITL